MSKKLLSALREEIAFYLEFIINLFLFFLVLYQNIYTDIRNNIQQLFKFYQKQVKNN